MNNEIFDFIKRFPINEEDVDQWMGHNDYYFARILKARFKGEIWYDLVNCHFLFRYFDDFYDWTGLRAEYDFGRPETMENMVKWSNYKTIDPVHYDRIVRDVIN